ncbi:MAG TPA: bifunctional protein-serine/threonine kinase/phosphatase, partial [Burkholderiales bacterium]
MLQVTLGQSSLAASRPRNEDFCAAATPEGAELDAKGLVAAVADGVGGLANGREASERTVRGLLADYYATPDTWS